MAPRRRAPPGPPAPDGDLAGAGHPPRRAGAELRAAPDQRESRTSATASGRCSPRRPPSCPAGVGAMSLSQSIFALTQELPYDFGVVTQLLNETDERFNTGSMRNIYSPDTAVASRARHRPARGADGARTRWRSASSASRASRSGRCCARSPRRASWGRAMPAGTAQGIAVHSEYKGATACWWRSTAGPRRSTARSARRSRRPRVTKAVMAVDAGLVINPRGLEAQMIGRLLRRPRADADQQLPPARRALPRGELGQLLLHPPVEHAAGARGARHGLRRRPPRRRRRGRRGRLRRGRRLRLRPGDRRRCRRTSRSTTATRVVRAQGRSCPPSRSRPPTACSYTY